MNVKDTLIAICFGLFPLHAIYSQTTTENDSIIREEATKLFNRGYYNKSIVKCLNIDSCSLSKDDYIILSKNYEHLENLDSAIIYRKKAFAQDNKDSENLVTLSKDFMDLGLPDSSLIYINQYKKIDSTNLVVNRQRAFALYTLNKYKDALNEYRSLKSMGDNQSTSNYYMGLCYVKVDSLMNAFKCLDTAVKQTQRKIRIFYPNMALSVNN